MRGFLAFLCFVGIFSASVVLSGCGGSSSSVSSVTGDNKVYVTGRFGSDYAYYKNHWWNRLFPRALATYGTVEKLVAVPIVRGDVWVGGIQEVQVGSDGSFSLSLTKQCEGSNWCEGSNATWVVLVKKTDGTYQTLSVGAQDIGDSLVDFPIYLAATNIDVGTLSSSRDEARGDKDVSDIAPNFSVGASKLENIAMVDDVLKSLVNLVRNNYEKYGKDENKYIYPMLHVVFSGNYTTLSSTYTIADTFGGYAFHFHAEPNSVISTNFNNIRNGTYVLRLFPPENITAGGATYNATNPISSFGLLCGSTSSGDIECSNRQNFWMKKKSDDNEVTLNFIIGDNVTQLVSTFPIPSGDFELKMGNTTIGTYKFSTALPLVNATAGLKLKLPVPKVKLNVDDDGKIRGVYVKWYVWNATSSSYEELTDYTFLKDFSSGGTYEIHITDYDGIASNRHRLDISCEEVRFDQTYVNLEQCENYPNGGIYFNYSGEDKYSADNLSLNYLGAKDVEYRFSYRKP
jgi:hypothetical protein